MWTGKLLVMVIHGLLSIFVHIFGHYAFAAASWCLSEKHVSHFQLWCGDILFRLNPVPNTGGMKGEGALYDEAQLLTAYRFQAQHCRCWMYMWQDPARTPETPRPLAGPLCGSSGH